MQDASLELVCKDGKGANLTYNLPLPTSATCQGLSFKTLHAMRWATHHIFRISFFYTKIRLTFMTLCSLVIASSKHRSFGLGADLCHGSPRVLSVHRMKCITFMIDQDSSC